MSEYNEMNLEDLDPSIVANRSVATSSVKIDTLAEGEYEVTVKDVKLRPSRWDEDRMMANLQLRTEKNRVIFAEVTWVPATNDRGVDKANVLYSQIEQALGMYGQAVKEVFEAALEHTFTLELVETARVEVGELPEEKQAYYLNTKNLGETDKVKFYINADDEETRNHLASAKIKLRNEVKNFIA